MMGEAYLHPRIYSQLEEFASFDPFLSFGVNEDETDPEEDVIEVTDYFEISLISA